MDKKLPEEVVTAEAELSKQLRKAIEIHPGFATTKHFDSMNHGIPDISMDASSRTTWVEVKKVVRGMIIQRESQRVAILKKSKFARVFYILFDFTFMKIYIVRPIYLDKWSSEATEIINPLDNSTFNIQGAARALRKLHLLP